MFPSALLGLSEAGVLLSAHLQLQFTSRDGRICADAPRIVDFGPGTDVNYAFTAQTVMNPLGKSPPMCSEF